MHHRSHRSSSANTLPTHRYQKLLPTTTTTTTTTKTESAIPDSSMMKSKTILLLGTLFVFLTIFTVATASVETESSTATTCPNGACTERERATSMPPKLKVSELLSGPSETIVEVLGGIYEHSPWVAERFVADLAGNESSSPSSSSSITTVTELAKALKARVDGATDAEKLALLRAHPDLCEKVEALRTLTEESREEQSRSGLQSMEPSELATFRAQSEAYKKKHGFPFILAVRNARKSTVLSALEGRLGDSSTQKEFHVALEQVHKIAWMRLLTRVESDEAGGFLTCHVLDTANGIPARKMKIVLKRQTPEGSFAVIGEYVTNDDGRLEGGPALKGEAFAVGTYEWEFHAGDYFAARGNFLSGTPFLDVVPLRFGIDNPDDHYHVPLLVSPWGYSTYRGS